MKQFGILVLVVTVLVGAPRLAETHAAWNDANFVASPAAALNWTSPSPGLSCAPVVASVKSTCAATIIGYYPIAGATGSYAGYSGYQVVFRVSTSATTPFKWSVVLSLGSTGNTFAGMTYFPGWPIPAGSNAASYPSWTPNAQSVSVASLCISSKANKLPALTVQGIDNGDTSSNFSLNPAYTSASMQPAGISNNVVTLTKGGTSTAFTTAIC